MSKKSKKLGMQQLEEKAMMAGDVAASIDAGGNLNITEMTAGEDQSVQVYKLSNGGIRVQGLDGTQIYGNYKGGLGYYSSITFYGVDKADDLNITLGNGDDTVRLLNYNGGLSLDNVLIDVGGNYTFDDADIVSVSGLSTSNTLDIKTGADVDSVSVSGSTIGNSTWEDLTINTGAGADYVDVNTTTVADNLVVTTYQYAGDNDADQLTVDSVIADNIYAYMGNGDDEARVQWSTIDDDIYLDMGYEYAYSGQDNDYVYLGFNNVDDDINIYGRDGNDEVRAAYNEADDVDFYGGDGYDEFYRWIASNGQDSNDFDDLDLHSAYNRVYGYV